MNILLLLYVKLHNREENIVENLTNRETEILKLVTRGFSNEEIAQNLFISKHTVKMHISIILQKLEVRNRSEAAYLVGKAHLFEDNIS